MAVQYVNKGAFASGTGALTVGVPSGYTSGNLFLLMVESANEAISTPSGWTQVSNSPQYTGTAATAGGVRLAVFYKWVTGSESSVSVSDSGNHTTAIISEWSGVDSTTPIHLTAGRVDSTATTSLSCAGLTTTVGGCMIVNAIGLDKDAILADTDTLSSWANASLASITERHDQTISSGVGGGIAFASGIKTSAGAVSSTTATGDSSTTHAYITIALTPGIVTITGSTNVQGSGSLSVTASLGVKGAGTLTGSGDISAAGIKFSVLSGTAALVGTSSVSANGSASSPGQTVVATMDASKIFRVLDEVIENTSFIIGPTGIVEVGELIEGSVFELGPTGILTVVELIEGNV